MDSNHFGERIKYFRKERGLSQIDLSEKLNISQSAYAKVENGRTVLDVDRLLQIANFLGIAIQDFFEDCYQQNKLLINERYRNAPANQSIDLQNLIKIKNEQIKDLRDEVAFLRDLARKRILK